MNGSNNKYNIVSLMVKLTQSHFINSDQYKYTHAFNTIKTHINYNKIT